MERMLFKGSVFVRDWGCVSFGVWEVLNMGLGRDCVRRFGDERA